MNITELDRGAGERGLYPGLVPKRNGLGKPFFWGIKSWVITFLNNPGSLK
jgi:hypothetical protein